MASLENLVLLCIATVFAAGIGVLVWHPRRRKARLVRSDLSAQADAPVRLESIDLSPHEAPTREFAAYAEELAALSMAPTKTREISVHEPLALRGRAPSDLVPTSRASQPRSRRDEDDTLKVANDTSPTSSELPKEELLRMLGSDKTPNLGNIEIYYRLGLTYLTSDCTDKALKYFLIVDGVSPGYRDVSARLAQLTEVAPSLPPLTLSERLPRVVTVSGCLPKVPESALVESKRERKSG